MLKPILLIATLPPPFNVPDTDKLCHHGLITFKLIIFFLFGGINCSSFFVVQFFMLHQKTNVVLSHNKEPAWQHIVAWYDILPH